MIEIADERENKCSRGKESKKIEKERRKSDCQCGRDEVSQVLVREW